MESDEEKIKLIMDWAADNDSFDSSFVEDMLNRIEKGGSLTEKQSQALDNIIDKWQIE